MAELSTLGFGAVGDVVWLAHYAKSADPAEWKEAMEFCNSRAPEDFKVFIVLTGPATIDAIQRSEVSALYQKYKPAMIALTDSRLARGVMTALKWFGIPSSGFAPTELAAAMEHVERSELYESLKNSMASSFVRAGK